MWVFTSSPAVWLKARPWEAAGWHQRTNCTQNNVGFPVNGRPLWACHQCQPHSSNQQNHHRLHGALQLCRPSSLDLHADGNPICLFVTLASVCFPFVSLSVSFCPFPLLFSITPCPFLFSSFSFSAAGEACFSWQVKRHDGGLVSVTLHIFPSPLASSRRWWSILGWWLCILSSL